MPPVTAKPMFPPYQQPIVGPNGLVDQHWQLFFSALQSNITTNVTNGVTNTGNLTLNQLIVGNGGSDVTSQAYDDGQIPIGSTADGTVSPATLTAGTGISVVNAAHGITIASTLGAISQSTPTNPA